MVRPLVERFRARVRIAENGCHEWQGCLAKNGYGQIGHNNKILYTHRVAWLLAYGDPGKAYVLHKCDNRRCVNPEHLFLGTFQDNMDDMVAKRRHAYGVRNGHAKLTDDDARQILASKETTTELAERYLVSLPTISQLKSGRTWAHVRSEKI